MEESRHGKGRCRRGTRWGVFGLALLGLVAVAPATDGVEGPWRLGEAAGAPTWLEIGGTYRLRYEGLSSHLRPGPEGSDRLLASRLLLALRVGDDRLSATSSSKTNEIEGSRWDVPSQLHAPLRQDAVLLARAAANPAARGFLDYLSSAPVKAFVDSYGYAADGR